MTSNMFALSGADIGTDACIYYTSRGSIQRKISELIMEMDKQEVSSARTSWPRLKVVIDVENRFIVLVVERKCLDDVNYFKYFFRL